MSKKRLQKIIVNFGMIRYEMVCLLGPKDLVAAFVAEHMGDPLEHCVHPVTQRGMFYGKPGRPPIIWMPRRPRTPAEHATLAHECLHAVRAMFDHIGMALTIDTDEAFCHALGHAVETILTKAK